MNLEGNQTSIREACDAGLLAGRGDDGLAARKMLQVNEIGYRDVDARLPMQRDTLFRIASMTKPVTVAAAMSLVDEGKLALRDPIVRWLPELPRCGCSTTRPDRWIAPIRSGRAILVEDLLTHTSGLGYGFSVVGPISRAYVRLPFGSGPDAWLAALAELPLVHQPGERLTYGQSTDVVGVLVSRIEGKPFHQVLDERILQPLNMIDTGFHVTPEGRRRAATMYRLDDNDQLQHDVMGPPHITAPAFSNAGGGLWSTADDYLRFIEMLLREGTLNGIRVLSPESARLMRTDRLTDEHKRHNFLGRAVLGRARVRAQPVGGDRPGEVDATVRARWDRNIRLAGRVRDVVAGRS